MIRKIRLVVAFCFFATILFFCSFFIAQIHSRYSAFNICDLGKFQFFSIQCSGKNDIKHTTLQYKDFKLALNEFDFKDNMLTIKNSNKNLLSYKNEDVNISFKGDVDFILKKDFLENENEFLIKVGKIGKIKIKKLQISKKHLKIYASVDTFEDFASYLMQNKVFSDFGIFDVEIDAFLQKSGVLRIDQFMVKNAKFKIDGTRGNENTRNSEVELSYNFEVLGVFDLLDSVFNFLHVNRENFKIHPTNNEYVRFSQILTVLKSREDIKTDAGKLFLNFKKQNNEILLNGIELNELLNDENEIF